MASIVLFGEFPPPGGGMAQQAEGLARHLEQEGFHIFRVRTNPVLPRMLSGLDSVRIVRAFLKLPAVYYPLMRALWKSDVCQIFGNSYLSFLLFSCPALVLGALMRKRVILNYHGGSAESFLKKHGWWALRFFRLADVLTVPSGFLQEIFRRHGLNAVIIPNVIDLERFSSQERKNYRPRFIVSRHLEPEYGMDIIISAFSVILRKYPDAHLTIVGDGSQAGNLLIECEKIGIRGNVTFLGRVDNTRLPALYADSDIFLNASRVDNLPVSILEAFAANLPVITTRAGGIPYIVEHGTTGFLVDVDDADGLADMAVRPIRNPEEASHLVRNARKCVGRFSWGEVRLHILDTYQLG